ncbi:MAG: PrsW family glutamic-type intramembrane protease [Thermoanaerobaculia bacterium]|jgi:RsiW-degrading membrane proteinase PrsW (M82 family)
MTGSTLDLALKLLVGVAPVVLFLVTLVYLDSYKLVKLRRILLVVLVGGLAALACYAVNRYLLDGLAVSRKLLTGIAAPIVEESFKAALIFAMIRARRIGFLADAAIQGFAVGTGFALVENFYYLAALPDSSVVLWLIRGFGTAIMHGGTTALFAIISKGLTQSLDRPRIKSFLPGLALAIVIHALFNQFLLTPLHSTLLVLVILPYLLTYFFNRSEKKLQAWLGSGFDMDNEVLRLINSGQFTTSPIGLYLKSLRMFYPGEVLADMVCYLRLHTELSLRAKGILMMRESGLPVKPDPTVREKLDELNYLRGSIGKTAMMSLTPILRSSEQDLWQLQVLEES